METGSRLHEIFGDTISAYTRQQAIEDGVLVAVDEKTSREAGFNCPVSLTRLYGQIAWNGTKPTTNGRPTRTSPVVFGMSSIMAHMAIKRASGGTQLMYQLYRVPRGGRGHKARARTEADQRSGRRRREVIKAWIAQGIGGGAPMPNKLVPCKHLDYDEDVLLWLRRH